MALEYTKTPYFHIGRATELTGKDRVLYRVLEIIPGLLTWSTLILIVYLSAYVPVAAAFFIIIFDLYWLLKTIFLSMHLRQNWKRMRHNMGVNWRYRLESMRHEHINHMVLLPFYTESKEVVEAGLRSILESDYDNKKIIVVLAAEERAGEGAQQIAQQLQKQYENAFAHMLVTIHPAGVPGEMAGKGSNIAYAAAQAKVHILDAHGIAYKDVIVSAFDVDTVVYPQYFSCLTWHFLTAEDPYHTSFQPVPLYNNNIWDAPALSRVVATSGTFWQMIQQERPERLSTFSSHSVSFQSLMEVGYWQKNMVSEDSRIFWNLYLAHNSNYTVMPLAYPISMDANVGANIWETVKNIYKQQRRWTYGVENVPYVLFAFFKNSAIPFWEKMRITFLKIEGFWSLTTNPLIIFMLGWLPLILGGKLFNETVLSYNLPIITRNLMILAMSGLVLSAIISLSFLPTPPDGTKWRHKAYMFLQWALVPFTMVFFGSFPGIDAQTRLMLGKYMGFWVTPKGGSQNPGGGRGTGVPREGKQ